MLSARKIGTWLTLLLFIGGLFAPSALATTRANCPMKQAAQEAHCAAMPEPVPGTPICCHPQPEKLLSIQSITGGCCCRIIAAPERVEVPVILSPISEPVALPSLLSPLPLPPTIAANLFIIRVGDETAPRAPPLRGTPTRAPPFS